MLDFLTDLLSQPAFIAGIVVCIGLIALGKPPTEVVRATVRAILGFVLLNLGCSILVEVLGDFSTLFSGAFSMTGIVPSNEAVLAITLARYGTVVTFVFILALVLNIVLARFSPFKYVFLASDQVLYMASAITPGLMLAGLDNVSAIICGACIEGMGLVVMPALLHGPMREMTGEDCSMAHFGSLGYLFCSKLGGLIGNPKESIEDVGLPRSLDFLQDSNVSVSLVMMVLFFVVTAFAPAEAVASLAGSQNQWVWAFFRAITFAAGIYVLIAGVNILLEEITPAFKGFSDKIVPNAIPAYPCVVIFEGRSNALICGFLMSTLGGAVAMLIQVGMGLPVVLFASAIVCHFFCGGLAAMFGDHTGGRRGAFVGPLVVGFVITWLPILWTSIYGVLDPVLQTTCVPDTDFSTFSLVLGAVAQLGAVPVYILAAVCLAVPFMAGPLLKRNNERKEDA